jgi:hypothetical protein
MRTSIFTFAFALCLIAACGGTESTGPDTSVTIDQIVGVWQIDAVDVLKDTCKFPDMDTQGDVGTYSYLEKADETHVNTYSCGTDATCTTKSDMQTFAYSKGKMTIPAEQSDIASGGGCRAYIDIPQTTTILSSVTSASMTFGGTMKFEGTCDAMKTTPINDPAYPGKTMGDFDGCQISLKRTMSKQ